MSPPRDGVVRLGGGLEGEGSWEALLPRTSSEHHASALVDVGKHAAEGDEGIEGGGSWAWELLAAWFSGKEGSDTVTIYTSRLRRGDERWSKPVEVARDPGASLQNPVWLWDEDGGLLRLLFTSQRGRAQETSRVVEIVSRDRGFTWSSEPREVFAVPGTFIKSPPLRADPGPRSDWLLPMYHTPKGASKDIVSQFSEVRRSVDGGASWGPGLAVSALGQGLVQPDVVRLHHQHHQGGRLVCFFRQRYSNETLLSYVWRSESLDGGLSWSGPARTPLPNPNKHVQASVLPSGAILIVFNNNRGGVLRMRTGAGRERTIVNTRHYPLSVALSYDAGLTWPYVRDLEEEYDIRLEYSYPSVLATPDGWVHITHTWSQTPCRRCAIRYHRITEEWVKGSWRWGTTKGVYKPPGGKAVTLGLEILTSPAVGRAAYGQAGALLALIAVALGFVGFQSLRAIRQPWQQYALAC